MTYVITGGCLDILDRQCMEQCPVDAIYPGERMAYINPDECIDCGACIPVCPQSAIFTDQQTPDSEQQYVAINAEYFEGDAKDLDGPNPDHPAIAGMASRAQ